MQALGTKQKPKNVFSIPIVIVTISRAIGVYGGSGLSGICYNNLKKNRTQ